MTGEEIRNTLAKNIKKNRAKKGFSQAQLAEKADVSIPFISSIEQSSKWPYPDTLSKIANALEIEICELFFTEENETKSNAQTISVIKALVESQKKALDDFGKEFLK